MNKNLLKNYILIAFISFIFLFYNFYFDQGYWYDEWATLLSSDPRVPINEIFLRINGIYDGKYWLGSEENVPSYYYLLLRFFFSHFGFTAENGRLFSIIFFILTVLIFCILSREVLGKKSHFFAILILSLNPLLLWMANETRVDTFAVFFSTLNVYLFFKSIQNNKKKYFIFLTLSNVIMLSVYPLTFSIFFSQIFFLFYKRFIIKNINNKIFILYILIFFLSFISYLIFNNEYLALKFYFERPSYVKLQIEFFFSLYFNIFFGNKYFGAIYLLLLLFLLIKNFKNIFKNEIILFLSIIIISTYSMVVISSLYFTPIASPRYIIFIVPFLILWIIKNIFISEKIITNKIVIYSLIILPIVNILFTNNDRPVKKPPIKEAFHIIQINNTKNIYVPYSKYYYLYISRIGDVVNKKYKLIKIRDIDSGNIKKFAHLCMNNPRFKVGNLILPDEEECNVRFNNYKVENIIKINDFIIIFFQIK
jgi:uncharacterized membrane protein